MRGLCLLDRGEAESSRVALRDLTSKTSEPRVIQYDQWGKRIDDLQTSEGWRGLKAKMQEEGIIGIHFERNYAEFSRVYGFMKQFIATGDSDVVSSCYEQPGQ